MVNKFIFNLINIVFICIHILSAFVKEQKFVRQLSENIFTILIHSDFKSKIHPSYC